RCATVTGVQSCALPIYHLRGDTMSDALLTLQRVSAGYASQAIFADLDFSLAPGQFAALVGPTGGGKSTLLKLILGLLPCTCGSVQRLPQMTMGYVPQREIIDWRFPVHP